MATTQLGNRLGVVDKRATPSASTSTIPIATPANYSSEAALDARLTAINAGYFTATMLNQMTWNDKTYAVRIADDTAGI